MNNVNKLLEEVISEARAAHIPISDNIHPEVFINIRAKARLGRCVKKGIHFTIEISARLISAPELLCRQTLAHEVLHTCYGCQNHQVRWKTYAQRMNAMYGYAIQRVSAFEGTQVESGKAARYLFVCTLCGAEIKRLRQSKLTRHPERYRCKCGGRLALKGGAPL